MDRDAAGSRAYLAALCLLPWIPLAVNPAWIYSGVGQIDPWLYHAYFHRLPDYLSTLFPGTYYGTRLAWLLPGYAAYHLLPAHAANLALHLTFFYTALAAIYRTAALLTSRPAALVAAAAFATSWPVLLALGWDYVDGAVIAYCSIAVWAVVESSTRRRAWLMVVAGAAAAAMVHSNIGTVLLLPTVAIAYVVTLGRPRWRDVLAGLAGALALTAVLGAASAAAGGPWLFFMPSVLWTAASVGTQTFQYVHPLAWPGARRFMVPLVGIAAAAGALAAGRTAATRLAALTIAWIVLAFAAFDWTFSAALLQTEFYVSWVLPFVFIALAAALAAANLSPRAGLLLAAFTVAVQVIALTTLPEHVMLVLERWFGSNPALLRTGFILTATAAAAVFAAMARRAWCSVALVVVLAVMNLLAIQGSYTKPDPASRSQFDAVQQTLTFIDTHVPRNVAPLFWLQPGHQGQNYASIAATYLYLYSLVGDQYPRLPDDATTSPRYGATVRAGSPVVVVSDGAPAPETVAREFGRFQLGTRMGPSARVQTPHARFSLTLVWITADGP